MRTWIKAGRTVSKEGTTILYRYTGTPYCVESRKRHIPHAPSKVGGGTWDYTYYIVIKDGEEVAQMSTLRDAKQFVEQEVGA